MLAVIEGGQLLLYRRIAGRLVFWRRVVGSDDELRDALGAAQELTALASEFGGWANALRLGLYPTKPVHPTRVPTWIFRKDELDGRLR
jgi:hypothetical protein